jgi:hypothetical protein
MIKGEVGKNNAGNGGHTPTMQALMQNAGFFKIISVETA